MPAIAILLVLLLMQPASGKEHLIRTAEEFAGVSANLAAGDTVTIASGTYTDRALTIAASGTQEKPIVVRAETTGKIVFSGTVTRSVFQLTGDHIELRGMVFNQCELDKVDGKTGVLVEVKNSSANRITKCVFTGNRVKSQFMPLVKITGTGHDNSIDHCRFVGNIDCQDLQVSVRKESVPSGTLIEHNLFSDKPKVSWKSANGGECVQIGQDPILLGGMETKAVVRENRFIRCNGEAEIISNKSSRNTYANNTFENCKGELVLRGGHDCIVNSNMLSNGGGIRINGNGHSVTNNTVISAETGIRLMYGMAKGKSETGFYIAASGCDINGNRLEKCETGILIGGGKDGDWTGKFDAKRYPSRVTQDVPPFDNRIGDNLFVSVGKETVIP